MSTLSVARNLHGAHELASSMRRRSARGLVTLADQAVSSVTNFILSLVAIRTLSLAEFGSVAVAVLIFGLSLSVARALASEPLLIRYTDAEEATRKAALGDALGAGLLVGSVLSVSLVLASMAVSADVAVALTALALFLPLLLVQDTYRYGSFSQGRPDRALLLDTIWLVSTILALGVAATGPGLSVATVVAAWAGSGALSAAFGALQSGVLPRLLRSTHWLVRQRDLGIPMFSEQVVGVGSRQLVLFLITGYVGIGSLGAIQGARTLFGPLNVIFLGSTTYAIPETARLREKAPSRVRVFVFGVGALLLASTVGLAVLLSLAPDSWMRAVIGSSWPEIRPFLAPTAIAIGAMAVIAAVRSGYRGLAMPVASLSNTLVLAALRVIVGVGATFAYGALGGAYGLAGANALGAIRFSHSFDLKTRNLQGR